MKSRIGLAGLLLACSLSGCASLKNSTVDVMGVNVHKPEVRQVESSKQAELLPWQVEYQRYSLQKICLEEKQAPPILGNGFAHDVYNFYNGNERTLNFIGDVYNQDFSLDVLRIRY